MNDKTYGQTEVFIQLAHPLGVTAGKIVVDGYDVNAVARKRVEVRGQGSHKGFTFTCFHFGDSALVEHDAADDLNGEVLHAQHTPACLAADGKRVGQNIVGGFAVGETLL